MAQKTTQTKTDNKVKRDIALVQISTEVHKILKDYCDHHGYKMSALVSNLIRKNCK
jgi:hypothetical protein